MRGRRPGERDDHRAALTRRAVALAALAVVTGGVTFAPWASSGARTRSSYEIVDVAGRAGVIPGSLEGVAVAWFLVPVVCGLVLVGLAVGRVRLAAVLGATLGAFVTTGGVLVLRSPLDIELGAVLGAGTGTGTVLAAAALVVAQQTGRDDERPVGSDEQR